MNSLIENIKAAMELMAVSDRESVTALAGDLQEAIDRLNSLPVDGPDYRAALVSATALTEALARRLSMSLGVVLARSALP